MRFKHLISFLVLILLFSCNNRSENKFTASGIIEGTAVKVSAQTGGLILDVNVEEGQDVVMGQVIAVIDTEKLVYQAEQIQAGIEELTVQNQISLNTYERAKLEYNHLKTKYQRYQDLYEKNTASKQVIDDLKNAFDVATTQLENARQSLNIIKSKRKGLEAQRKLLARQIKDASITAPLSGTITTKYFQKGETVPIGFAVVEIIDLQKMWTKVYVSELVLPKIKVGQNAEIRIDGTEQALSGRVSWISSKAEFTPKNILTEESRTSLVYAVKVEVVNPDKILKHGMPVEIALDFSL